MVAVNPLTGIEIVTNVTLNMTQYMQLRQDIISSQQEALFVGLVLGCIIGVAGALVGVWRYNRTCT